MFCFDTQISHTHLLNNRYDTTAHLAEETHEASENVAKGIWAGTLCSWILSIPVSCVINPHCLNDAVR